LCVSNLLFSQTFHFKIIDPIICYDYVNKKIIAIEDSSYRLEITPSSEKAIKKPLYWDKQVSFQSLKTSFIPLSSKGSPIYFVDRGCGWVLQLRNDSIVRVDQSFHHQNQFGGAFFMHNGTPHIFGGYGLFSYKNFITKYDKDLRQWYLENEGAQFIYRDQRVFSKTSNLFHVLLTKNQNEKIPKKLWAYDFNKKEWSYDGEIQGLDSIKFQSIIAFKENFIIGTYSLHEFDFNRKRMKYYRIEPINTVLKVIKVPDLYMCLSQVYESEKNVKSTALELYNQKEFDKQFLVSEHILKIKDKSDFDYLYIVLFLLAGVVLFVLIRYYFKVKGMKKNQMPLSFSTNKLLELWLSKSDYLLELSELNDLVNHDEPSPDTIKKRRENLLRQFSDEITLFYDLELYQIYHSEAHPTDKRMKRVRLSTEVIDKIKKGKSH
jgi:hypothetical protein